MDTIAEALHYSKYHLHRMFTETVGLTILTCAQRRRLTEAAKLLVFSDKPILEIALTAGYESQQSFTDSFRAMYKKALNRYREEEQFYPLQLRYVLNESPAKLEGEACLWQKIACATEADIPAWMELVHLVIDGFPHLDEEQYLEQLREYIGNRRALILKDAGTAVGIMAFHERTGSIDFLGVHPQYRKRALQGHFVKRCCTNWYAPKRSLSRLSRRATRRIPDTGRRSKALALPRRNCWSSSVTRHSGSYRFAVPTIVTMLLIGLYTIVDTIFVARFAGTNALSALFIDSMIWGLGASEILFPYCREYLFLLLLFTPASMMQVLFQNLIVTAGCPGIGMVLGVGAGAALGTGIGYLIPTVAGILFFAVGNGSLQSGQPRGHFII